MASNDNVFCNAGFCEDGFFQLLILEVLPPVVLNLGAPGDAVHALPFRALGGSILDLDLLYGILGKEGSLDDIQPIFAFASREGFIRSYGKEVPRPAIQDACIGSFGTLLSVGDIIIDGTPIGPNLFGSVGLTTRPTFEVVLDNGDGEWNLLVLRELVSYAPAGIFVDIAHTQVAAVVTGTISSIRFDGSTVRITGGFSARTKGSPSLSPTMDLDQIIPLRRASEYAFPKNATDILPEIFGNWLSPDAGAVGAGEIATPCILIDTENLVFCANARATASTPPQVFWKGGLVDASQYIWNPANNYEGKGTIATLQFRLNIVSEPGVITIRHGGAVDGSGLPITNPVMMLYTMLTERAYWTLDNFDRGTCEQTRADYEQLGYPAYWVWQEERSIRDWLLDLCAMAHTDFTESGNAQLAVILDRTITELPVLPDYHIHVEDIEDHGIPATAISLELQSDDVVNQVVLKGRYSWAADEYTAAYTWDYLQSQHAYGAIYPAEFEFRGMYTMQHAARWLHNFAIRHGFDPTVVSFSLRGLKGLPLIPPRVVTIEWPRYEWVQHILKIRQTVISFENRQISLQAIDCQRELTDTIDDPAASPIQRLRQLSRIYQYIPGTVGQQGRLPDAPQDTRNEAANGNFEEGDTGQFDVYAGNPIPQWRFIEDANEAHHGRWLVRLNLGAGDGIGRCMRTRIDPGEWAIVSAQFKQTTIVTNGEAVSIAFFYDIADTLISVAAGNPVVPTDDYLESVCFVHVPDETYYYRPGIGFSTYPSFGEWDADSIHAVSGTLEHVIAARPGDITSRNAIINGDFERGPVMWVLQGAWRITNDPAAAARSGIWKAVHVATGVGSEERLSSMTKISVTQGQTFTAQVHVITLNNPNGTGRLGVTWLDGQGGAITEHATSSTPGPFFAYTLAGAGMTVPAGAVTAHFWIGITGHSIPGTYWLFDDAMISTG